MKAENEHIDEILPAVYHLPREILAHIFSLTLALNAKTTLDTNRGLWPFTRVSRIWREAALSLTAVWASIFIDFDERRDGTTRPEQGLRTAFSYANGRPVTLWLEIRTSGWRSTTLLEAATDYSGQWQAATLTLPRQLLPRLKRLEHRIPVLEFLGLHFYGPNTVTICSVGPILSDAPALRCLAFRGFHGISHLKAPWQQIQNLWHASHTQEVIALLPELQTLDTLVFGYAVAGEMITHTKIRTIELFTYHHSIALDSLVLPALEELRDVSLAGDDVRCLANLIKRSRCRIKTLGLGFSGKARDRILDLFSLAQSTTVLSLGLHFDLRNTSLTTVLMDGSLLPGLEELKLTIYQLLDSQFQHVLELIDVLVLQRPQPIKSVVILMPPWGGNDEETNYGRLRQKFGLVITRGKLPASVYGPQEDGFFETWNPYR